MRTRRFHVGLPLLAKELTEQAARRRTYVLRTLYGVLLFFVAALLFLQQLGTGTRQPLGMLGQGREIFGYLIWFQFAGIYLFVPPLTCSALTAEKERNSLGLLFLTRLGPWTILFEKLGGRLVPMFTFLLLSLPVFAFTYALGGISPQKLWLAVWYLTITALQVASLALLCSAFFRTTAAALIGCYLLLIAMYFAPPLLQVLEFVDWRKFVEPIILAYGLDELRTLREATSMLLFGPTVYMSFSDSVPAPAMMVASIPIVMSIGALLGLARFFLVRRAFVQPRNMLVRLFRVLDGWFTRMNQNRVTRGIVLIEERSPLPEDDPVAWRETTKKSLGTARYLIRVLLALELPAAAFCLLVTGLGPASGSGMREVIVALVFLYWIIAGLIVTVASTNLIAGERGHETLDVLLVTPLSGRQLIEEKLRGVRRLLIVVSAPLVTLLGMQAAWLSGTTGYTYSPVYRDYDGVGRFVLFCIVSLLSVVVYLRVACWLSFWIGLKVRSQARAVVAALAGVTLWVFTPLIVVGPVVAVWNIVSPPSALRIDSIQACYALSPGYMLWQSEFLDWRIGRAVWWYAGVIFVHFALQWQLLRVLRSRCLNTADRLLGRE